MVGNIKSMGYITRILTFSALSLCQVFDAHPQLPFRVALIAEELKLATILLEVRKLGHAVARYISEKKV